MQAEEYWKCSGLPSGVGEEQSAPSEGVLG